jgi:hypothetical protein
MDWNAAVTPQTVGVVIGAGIALVGSVLGSVITQWWTSRRDEKRYEREQADRRDGELRAAYAEWMGANHRALVTLTNLQALPVTERMAKAADLAATLNVEILTGTKVQLLEHNSAARLKTIEALDILSMFAAKLSVATGTDFGDTLHEIGAASRQLGELQRWVLETRFPPK